MKKILVVVGTRPNFVKITQFKKEAIHYPELDVKIVHTGQHFDHKMADVFFQQFSVYPDFYLNALSTGVVNQFADIMVKLEELIDNVYKPDLLVVVGDVNSTLSACLVGNKKGIRIAHLESGLRSLDYSMPEEVNRILTDYMSDIYFITEKSGYDNLTEIPMPGKKFMVGNTMIDTLIAFEDEISESDILEQLEVDAGNFALVTIHRPSNVDDAQSLLKITELLEFVTQNSKVVFPIHPRTLNKLAEFNLLDRLTDNKQIVLTEPLSYFPFQKLVSSCKYIVTDSGGIQEESTFRKKPCLTLRPNTERPSTVEVGSNILVKFEVEAIADEIKNIQTGKFKQGSIPELWDGKATKRILEIIATEV